MAFDYNKGYDIGEDGLVYENGVHSISGSPAPNGLINPSNPSIYTRNNGELWFHLGTGGINAWFQIGTGGSSFSTFRCVFFYDMNQQIPAVTENLFEAEISGGTISLNTLIEQVI